MYYLNSDQMASLEVFGAKLESSLIKSKIETWVSEIPDSGRVTSEELEQFVSFATHLPKELSGYPQSFAYWVKNGELTERQEKEQATKAPVKFAEEVNKSIAHVSDAELAPDETAADKNKKKTETKK